MAVAQQDRDSLGSGDEERRVARPRNARDLSPALTLADLRPAGAAERIAALLRRPDVAPQAGALLFALDELGGRLPPESRVDVLHHGSFEARSEALRSLDDDRVSVPDPAARHSVFGQPASLVAGADQEAAEAARDAIPILRERTGRSRSEARRT